MKKGSLAASEAEAARATAPSSGPAMRVVPGGEAFGDFVAHGFEDVGLGFEEVFVEIEPGFFAGAEGEVSFEEGDFLDAFGEGGVVHFLLQ